RASSLVIVEAIHKDIMSAQSSDPALAEYLSHLIPENSHWTHNADGLVRLDKCIYIPDTNDLCLRILRYKHDHPLSRHFGRNCTLELIHHEYTWPCIRTFIKDYMSSCTTCACAKVPRHKLFGLLK